MEVALPVQEPRAMQIVDDEEEEEVDEETLRLLEGIGGAQDNQGAQDAEEEEEVDEEMLRLLEGVEGRQADDVCHGGGVGGDDHDEGGELTSDDEETLRMLDHMDPTAR